MKQVIFRIPENTDTFQLHIPQTVPFGDVVKIVSEIVSALASYQPFELPSGWVFSIVGAK